MSTAETGGGPAGMAPAGDDGVRPFEVAALDVRGRAIQMGPAIDAILARHAYPAPVSKLLGEAIVLAVLLGSSLKFDGKFILQTETDGPVDMLVVDYATSGGVRAYARFDEAAVDAAAAAGASDPATLLGRGTLAMTIDQGAYMNRYQGVVALDGDSLEAVAHAYFRQSEQIPTRVRLAVGEMHERRDGALTHAWRAGGLLVQFLPESPARMRQADLPGGDVPEGMAEDGFEEDDAWVEAQSLVGTVEDHELTDPAVPVDTLLYRLFHERGVRVFNAAPVRDACTCSRDRVHAMLASFTAEEIAESVEDGRITVTCEFCNTRYDFDPDEFATVAGEDGGTLQ
ncbi:MAG TPA: Hsp33 family molecular chaperone [Bauldia sp.]|nr:Hsp33 family molecular chaperone [Bauldia sp.]